MKKIILIIAVVLVAGVGVWYLFLHKTSVPVGTTTPGGSPFGTAPTGTTDTSNGGVDTSVIPSGTVATGTLPVLFRVASDPVAGAVVFIKNKQEMIRYVDRATGHIYEVDPLTLAKTEILNNTAPKIYEAAWKPDGSTVIVRSLATNEDTILNTSLALTPPKSTSTDAQYTAVATELRGNVSTLVPNTTNIAYVLKDTGQVMTSGFAGEKPTSVYTSAFDQWQIAWSTSGLVLTANTSASTNGDAYLLKSGILTKLLGPLIGLTSKISPDGSRIVYSYVNGANTVFNTENLKNKINTPILPSTFPEKCAWSVKHASIIYCGTPSGGIGANEPDNWYQGVTHFSDQIWKFDTDTGVAILLATPKKTFNVDLDMENISISPNEDYMIFMNRTDLSLWAFKIQ